MVEEEVEEIKDRIVGDVRKNKIRRNRGNVGKFKEEK